MCNKTEEKDTDLGSGWLRKHLPMTNQSNMKEFMSAYFFFHWQIENSAQDFALYIIFATGGKCDASFYTIPVCYSFLPTGEAQEQLTLFLWKKGKEGKKKKSGEGILEGYSYRTVSEEDNLWIRYPRRVYNTKEFAFWPDIKLPEWQSVPGRVYGEFQRIVTHWSPWLLDLFLFGFPFFF